MTISGIPNIMMTRSATARLMMRRFVEDFLIFWSLTMTTMTSVFPTMPVATMMMKMMGRTTRLTIDRSCIALPDDWLVSDDVALPTQAVMLADRVPLSELLSITEDL